MLRPTRTRPRSIRGPASAIGCRLEVLSIATPEELLSSSSSDDDDEPDQRRTMWALVNRIPQMEIGILDDLMRHGVAFIQVLEWESYDITSHLLQNVKSLFPGICWN